MAVGLTIVHIQTRFARAGAEENTWACCVHQAGLGHRVIILCGPDSNIEFYESMNQKVSLRLVPSLVREISPKKDLRCYREIRDLLKEINPDVVHTHTSKAGIIGRAAAASALVPTVIHGVHILPFSNIGLFQKLLYLTAEHIAALWTNYFVHVSYGTRDAYRVARIGSRRPHMVVRSGMEIAKFVAAPWPEDWRSILGIPVGTEKPKVLLMMAALERRKRHHEFLDGFAAATAPGEPIRVIFAGEGEERENLEAHVQKLGLNDRVKFVGHRPDAERLVALSDIGVLSSLREGLPRVVVQYLAGGKPSIVSPLRGIEEIVKTGVNGIILKNTSASSVAREAVNVARDTSMLEFLTKGAELTEVSGWSKAAMFDQLDRAYVEALGTSYNSIGPSEEQ
ncbi:glycosyltransferase [Sphingomonas sp. BIUV-7]|uniref:Glycosyltransferase n=1 Tax=Sphingomonas natans TaxID=3063330 RepID=A0ABT8YE73_9SPHN|nr:glycosyltransferase [Sphingomonas sp. BIUV-7]MDO6416083.1 glycosyltransferase [Sphingomonas sp. BIUV-7]